MNEGLREAIEPKFILSFSELEKKDETERVIMLGKLAAGIAIVPVKTFTNNPDLDEYVYSILHRGFENIKTIEAHLGRPIVLGFAFENGSDFYFAEDYILHLPIPFSLQIRLMAGAKNTTVRRASKSDFYLYVESWNKMRFVPVPK